MQVWLNSMLLLLPACRPHSHVPPLHYSGSCAATGSQGSLEDFDISISPSSFASLPRPTPLLDDLSQDAMLGEIAELTRQNAVIRAQLEKHRPSPAGASVSREQSTERLSAASSVVRQVLQHTQQVSSYCGLWVKQSAVPHNCFSIYLFLSFISYSCAFASNKYDFTLLIKRLGSVRFKKKF